MFNKIIFYLYCMLFFVTPLLMASSTSEIFEFNKIIFIYGMTIIILTVWICKMISAKRIVIRKTVLDKPIILFLFALILSTLFSIDKHTSLWGYYGRFNNGTVSVLAFISLYYAFVSNVLKEQGKKLLLISLISSFVVVLWGLPGKFGLDLTCLLFLGELSNSCWTDQFRPAERMFSTLGQPNWLGAYLAIHFFIGLFFLYKAFFLEKKYISYIYLAYMILNFFCILFTRSRSALVSVLVGIVLFPILIRFTHKEQWNLFVKYKRWFMFICGAAVISMFIFKTGIGKVDQILNFQLVPNAVNTKVSTVSSAKPEFNSEVTESFDIRKIVWQGAFDLSKRYPLFGTGVETFAYAYYFVRPQEHNLTSEWDYLYNRAHNEFMNYVATTGYIGLLTYILLIGTILWIFFQSSKKDNEMYLPLFFAYGSILITNFFGFSTSTINIFFYILPAFVFLNKENHHDVHNMNGVDWKISIVPIMLSIYLMYSVFSYWYADTLYKKGNDTQAIKDYPGAIAYYKSALRWRSEHVYEDKLSYTLANAAAYSENKEEIKTQVLEADLYNNKTLQASSKNVLYWKTRAKNYYIFYYLTTNKHEILEGINALNQAMQLAPTDPKIPYSQAIYYSLLYDVTKDTNQKRQIETQTLKNINQTLELKPNYKDGYLLKGQLLKKFGRKAEANKEFQYILDHFDSHDADAKKELAP